VIAEADKWTTEQLHAYFMAQLPFLSSTALKEYLEKNKINGAALLDLETRNIVLPILACGSITLLLFLP